MFIKIPAPSVVELLGTTSLDFVAVDAEHAPFGIEALDGCILAGRAAGVPVLVRVPDASSPLILSVLDMGAAGIIVPHIRSTKDAGMAASAARYGGGTRGFSGSHRAAGYGTIPAETFKAKSDSSTIIIGQVEDRQGVENIDEISEDSALDALFIGPADLATSYGVESWDHPTVQDAIDRVCARCRHTDQTLGIFLANSGNVAKYRDKGVSFFIISTDQALLLKGACALSDEVQALRK